VNTNRMRRDCPTSEPVMTPLGSSNGQQFMRYADVLTPESKSIPEGATEIQVYRVVAAEPAVDVAEAVFVGKYTRNPIQVGYAHADNRKFATYYARWAGLRGTVSPWSVPLSMNIAA
ncbi:MAG TPA: hypothetical protein VK324_08835, partial [Tepidisphaeraceae bacterium]|nr:hypothetical protein [Tepidisphaeraceae bacterium]